MARSKNTPVGLRRLVTVLLFVVAGLLATGCQTYTDTTVGSKSAANETAAIGALRTISSAQAQFSVSHEGDYGTFDDLVKAGHLDVRFSSSQPVIGGYVLTMKVSSRDSDGNPASYAINADPEKNVAAGSTGNRHFFMDSTNTIRVNPKQSAGSSDPQL